MDDFFRIEYGKRVGPNEKWRRLLPQPPDIVPGIQSAQAPMAVPLMDGRDLTPEDFDRM